MESRQKRMISGLHQCTHHSPGVQAAQVTVRLPGAHKHDGLTCDVRHGDSSSHLVINSVKLGEDDAVNKSRLL